MLSDPESPDLKPFSKIQRFAPLKASTSSEVVRLAHWVVTCSSQPPRCLQITTSLILLTHFKNKSKDLCYVYSPTTCTFKWGNSFFVRRIQQVWNLKHLGFQKKTAHWNTSESVCFVGWFTNAGQEGKVRKVLVVYVWMKYQEVAANTNPDSTS